MESIHSREAVTLLAINGIFSFALSLGGIFLQVFLFTLGGFRAVVEYNLISACFVIIFYMISGWLLARMTLKNLLLLGLVSYIVLFSILFLFREQSLALLIPLGTLNGAAMGMFWAAMNLLQYMFTTDGMRHRFFGRQSFLFSVTGGVAPMLGGVIISLTGVFVFKELGYSFVFFFIALLMGVVYREAKKLPDHERILFSVRDVIGHQRSYVWKLVLVQDFFYGIFDFMFVAFAAVLVFILVKEEFILGIVNAAGAMMGAAAALTASFVLGKKQTLFVAASVMAAVGVGLFAGEQNWWGLLALIFLFNAGMPVVNVAWSKTFFDIVDESGGTYWQKKYYLFFEREVATGLGRIVSLLIFFLFVNEKNQYEIARVAVGLLAVMPLCIGFILYRITRCVPTHHREKSPICHSRPLRHSSSEASEGGNPDLSLE